MHITLIIFVCLVVLIVAIRLMMSKPTPNDYLAILSKDVWKSGREVREEVKQRCPGILSIPRFYNHMSRLIELKMVEAFYTFKVIEGNSIKVAHYRLIS